MGSYLLDDEEEEERVAHQPRTGDQGEDDPGQDVLQPGQALVTHSTRLGVMVFTLISCDQLPLLSGSETFGRKFYTDSVMLRDSPQGDGRSGYLR